jgi:hypothetical protein
MTYDGRIRVIVFIDPLRIHLSLINNDITGDFYILSYYLLKDFKHILRFSFKMSTKSLCESTHNIVLLRGPTAAAQPLNYRNRESLKNYETKKHFKQQLGLIVSLTN